MPIYLYEHPKTKEVKEVFQSMSEPHVYSEGKIEWKRIWTVPTAGIDTKIPMTSQAFVEKTRKSKGTLGDLYDQAKEASEKRKHEQGGGMDPLRKKALEDWGKKRDRVHPELKYGASV